jgi:hypothetical protein
LAVNVDGRFPDVTRHIPRVADATARFALSAADAAFLAQTLPKLPCDDAYNYPLTLDLNGSIAIRAKAADQAKPTEIVLSGSSWSGEPMRLNMNRKFLVRALKLGFSELLFYGPEVPVACHDERRDFVWATLGPETAIPPAEDAIRFESPKDNSAVSISQPVTPRRSKAVSETTPNSNGKAASNGHANTTTAKGKSSRRRTNQQDIAALIEQAIKLRTALHDRTHEAGELVKALKQYRRANRAIQQTLSSIRQLKGLGV